MRRGETGGHERLGSGRALVDSHGELASHDVCRKVFASIRPVLALPSLFSSTSIARLSLPSLKIVRGGRHERETDRPCRELFLPPSVEFDGSRQPHPTAVDYLHPRLRSQSARGGVRADSPGTPLSANTSFQLAAVPHRDRT